MTFYIHGYLEHTANRWYENREELDEAIKNETLVETYYGSCSNAWMDVEDEKFVFVFTEIEVDGVDSDIPLDSIRVEYKTKPEDASDGSCSGDEKECEECDGEECEDGIVVSLSANEGFADFEKEVPGEFDASKLYFIEDGGHRKLMYGDVVLADGREADCDGDMNGYDYEYSFCDESTGEEVSDIITVW